VAAVKAKHQRLTLLIAALAALGIAAALAISALGDRATYFYSPNDVAVKGVEPGRAIRLGGMVGKGSVRRLGDGVTTRFVVTDFQRSVPVTFKGIVPDLFREGSGVIAEGRFDADGVFVADNLLAKHDERYMPPELAGSIKNPEHKAPSLETSGLK
jgi:cytochrome c-type biogenesis protein CcmE